MPLYLPPWMKPRVCSGDMKPAQSFTPHVVQRTKTPQEHRGTLAIDHWGIDGWADIGHGHYAWHCPISGDLPWIKGADVVPQSEHKQLVYLQERRITFGGDHLTPGLYLGKCTHGVDGYQWAVKYRGNYYRVSSQHLYWVPLPANDTEKQHAER